MKILKFIEKDVYGFLYLLRIFVFWLMNVVGVVFYLLVGSLFWLVFFDCENWVNKKNKLRID